MRRWQILLGLAVSAVFLVWALRGLRLESVWESARTARIGWILPGVAAYFLGVGVRAWRWHYLLRPLGHVSTRTAFPLVAIGYMGNNLYPARAGEVLRAYVLRRRTGIPMSGSLATILVERALDGVVMLGFVFLNLPELARAGNGVAGASDLTERIYPLALAGAVAFLGATVAFVALAVFPRAGERLLEVVTGRLIPARFRTRARSTGERFLVGLGALRSPGAAAMLLLTSALIWLLETGKYWFVMLAFPFRVSFFVLMLMNGIVNLATTIPSAPGYLGTFDAPGVAVLSAAGVAPEVAAAYTLVLHAALWLPITALGAYYFARESVTLKQARTELAESRAP
ncbi:MAG: lysylphosphatidylglycerol synthase transmembrane domain-containing protein [Anaerolineales bacterium]